VNFLYGWDGRPQEFATQLGIGELDVAIAGDDWIRERVLELKYEYARDIELRRVMSLGRGSVRLVGIVNPDKECQRGRVLQGSGRPQAAHHRGGRDALPGARMDQLAV
jgi:ATP phosphoribosyltransferase